MTPDQCRHADAAPATSRSMPGHPASLLTRRGYLTGTASAAGVALAGCLGGDGAAPAAVRLTDEDNCDMCGMVITAHPGPDAEIFYADQRPEGHDNPARFCSGWEAFKYDFARQAEGWSREAFYVTDYSTVAYEVYTEAGTQYLSSHPTADAFGDATEMTFLVGPEPKGAMGKDLVGFSDPADAESFQGEYGGDRLAFDEITEGTIAGLGMG